MNILEIIEKKQRGFSLNGSEIAYTVDGYVSGLIPDYQMAAFLMAVYFKGMNERETFHLTDVMMSSGEILDLKEIKGFKVDKHSSGGVGDKVSLVALPIAAAAGVKIAKMSGRGLGFTGGTVDKLEAIPGFKVSMTGEEFIKQVDSVGMAIMGQTGSIAAADKKIYALRSATSTVQSLPLIVSSIMSKKLASGNDAIVLDVKFGNGALMEKYEDAENLASQMVKIGKRGGKKMAAVLSSMEEPLGVAVGNSLEVIEAVEILKGGWFDQDNQKDENVTKLFRGSEKPVDTLRLSLEIAGNMIYLAGGAESPAKAKAIAEDNLLSGRALKKFKALVTAQGGSEDIFADYESFGLSDNIFEIKSSESGYIHSIRTDIIGKAALSAGVGRVKKNDPIDFSAGIIILNKIGDYVEKGRTLARITGRELNRLEEGIEALENTFIIRPEKAIKSKLIGGLII